MSTDIIKLLPDSVANQIAAGEVIQRPASVVKELVENAVDAGATSIQIIIKDAGRTLIQVIDNGKGMTPTDARMAFERHATSKIASADDLYSLHTMGFRGEALPSIAAVAQIELRTLPKGETIGSRLLISESKFEGQEPYNCAPGTNIMVRNLFFHMPARRKFLKKDTVELGHILREFERLALVNTNIDFTIIHNDTTLHQLTAGSLKHRVDSLFGRGVAGQLIPVGTETSIVKIEGFIGAPAHAKKRNAPQFFFVNGRNMRHPYFHKAVMNCYSELISPDSQPAYFINFEVEPATIDVNIHPQKHEIKFENEQAVWQILTAAVKQSLGKANVAGALDFDMPENVPDVPFLPDTTIFAPDIRTGQGYNPFNDDSSQPVEFPQRNETLIERKSRGNFQHNLENSRAPKDWNKLYEDFAKRMNNPELTDSDSEDGAGQPTSSTNAIGQKELFPLPDETRSFHTLDNRYLIVPSRSGLLMIHRRRAHIRVLFNQFMERLTNAPLQSQRLIFPETLTLSPSHSAIMSSISDLLIRLGFEVSFLGDNVWAINAVPALPCKANPVDTLSRLVSDIEDIGDLSEATLIEPAALTLARSAAFTHLSEVSAEETDSLIAALFSCPESSFTPDGLTIIHTLELNEIQRFFN